MFNNSKLIYFLGLVCRFLKISKLRVRWTLNIALVNGGTDVGLSWRNQRKSWRFKGKVYVIREDI